MDLDTVIKRNKVVNEYLGAISLEGLLKSTNLKLDDVEITLKNHYIRGLYASQFTTTPEIETIIEKGIWDAESNEFFEKGQEVDFTKEPILVIRYAKKGREAKPYAVSGHTRAKHILNSSKGDIYAKIPAIDIYHPDFEKYVDSLYPKRIHEMI